MTQAHQSDDGAVPVPPPMAFPASVRDRPHLRFSREAISQGVALRRERLADLEAQLADACEAAAARGDAWASVPGDRRRWDRAAWQRYLDAALRLERTHGPRMRRLRDDIARLERLLDLPLAG